MCGRREKDFCGIFCVTAPTPPPFEITYFQLWDFSIDGFFSPVFVSLVYFDLVSVIQVSPRHSAVIITFLGGVYFICFGLFGFF